MGLQPCMIDDHTTTEKTQVFKRLLLLGFFLLLLSLAGVFVGLSLGRQFVNLRGESRVNELMNSGVKSRIHGCATKVTCALKGLLF